jgi:hypothetical protein
MRATAMVILGGIVTCSGLVLACGGDSSGPNTPLSISGVWQLTANISNSSLSTTCVADGQVTISQSGQNFTGQVSGSTEVCSGPGGQASGSVDGSISGGQISGNSINYSDGTCTYTGTLTGSPPNRAQGNVSCSLPLQGQNFPFSGTWQISR